MTPSPSRHGSSWDTCRVCLCCVASGETGGKHKDVWPSRSELRAPRPRHPARVTYLEVGELGESLFTAGVGAFIRPVARVDSGV